MGPSAKDFIEAKGKLLEAASNLPENAALILNDKYDLIIKHPNDTAALKDEALETFLTNYATEIDAWLTATAGMKNANARAIVSLHHQANASGPRDTAFGLSAAPEPPVWEGGTPPPVFNSRWQMWPGTADRKISGALRRYRPRHQVWLHERGTRALQIAKDWTAFSLAALERYQARQSARQRLSEDLGFVEKVLRQRFKLIDISPKIKALFVVREPPLTVEMRIILPNIEHMPESYLEQVPIWLNRRVYI